MAKKEIIEKPKKRWSLILGILLFLFITAYILSGIISLFLSSDDLASGNVALIPIKGVIMTGESGDLFERGIASSGQIVEDIEKAVKNPEIKALILEIDSPGGTPVATDEIARAVKNARMENKTVVAWIRESGASGAYWIASASDYIVVNRMSVTGSIGVYGSYLGLSGLLDDWNITYQRLVAGKYKDTGSPLKELTSEEESILQKKIDLLHNEFKEAVKENRLLTKGEIDAIATGEFFLGLEAIDLKLVDKLGGKEEVIDYIKEKNPGIEVSIVNYKQSKGFLDILSEMKSENNLFFSRNMEKSPKFSLIS